MALAGVGKVSTTTVKKSFRTVRVMNDAGENKKKMEKIQGSSKNQSRIPC